MMIADPVKAQTSDEANHNVAEVSVHEAAAPAASVLPTAARWSRSKEKPARGRWPKRDSTR